MKHIKSYENKNMINPINYKIGDYVILDNKDIYHWTCLLTVKIIKKARNSFMPYTFLAIDKQTKKEFEISLQEEYVIKRKATEKEIDAFKLYSDIKKYNL